MTGQRVHPKNKRQKLGRPFNHGRPLYQSAMETPALREIPIRLTVDDHVLQNNDLNSEPVEEQEPITQSSLSNVQALVPIPNRHLILLRQSELHAQPVSLTNLPNKFLLQIFSHVDHPIHALLVGLAHPRLYDIYQRDLRFQGAILPLSTFSDFGAYRVSWYDLVRSWNTQRGFVFNMHFMKFITPERDFEIINNESITRHGR